MEVESGCCVVEVLEGHWGFRGVDGVVGVVGVVGAVGVVGVVGAVEPPFEPPCCAISAAAITRAAKKETTLANFMGTSSWNLDSIMARDLYGAAFFLKS
jgi:hypothetical protein